MGFQTYTGNILIAVNPFMRLPHLYDSHMMAQYKGAAFGELSPQFHTPLQLQMLHIGMLSYHIVTCLFDLWFSLLVQLCKLPFIWLQTYD